MWKIKNSKIHSDTLRFSWLRLEKTMPMCARNMRKHRKRFRSVMNRLIDKPISIMLRHSRLKKWERKWMNS